MSWERYFRQAVAAERREQREAQRRQKLLEKQVKELQKLSELEQARVAVEAYENSIEVLLSLHKDQGRAWDWAGLAVSLPPPCPQRLHTHEWRAKQWALVTSPQVKADASAAVERACNRDEGEYQEAVRLYREAAADHAEMANLARRIANGDVKAYTEAVHELSPFAEITQLGSSVHFIFHTPKLVECNLKVSGTHVIPAEAKSLNASGKLSVKAMPKVRFHEIYQDYVCSCILRVAREIFALLPIEQALITARTDTINTASGQAVEQAVISVAISRHEMACLDFDHLDPSDAVESFFHRGDFKATRKTEAFLPVTPLTPSDFPTETKILVSTEELLSRVRHLRRELNSMKEQWIGAPVESGAMPI